jgi:hypothetical protein
MTSKFGTLDFPAKEMECRTTRGKIELRLTLKLPVLGARIFSSLASTLGVLLMASGIVRAQVLPAVELHWQGPDRCPEASGVLDEAQSLLGQVRMQDSKVIVYVDLRDLGERGIELEVKSENDGVAAQRALTAPSCEAAKQAAALLIALILDPESALPSPNTAPLAPESVAPPEPPRAPNAPSPAQRSGARIGVGAAGELPALASVIGVLNAQVGWRWASTQVDAKGALWLPDRAKVDGSTALVKRQGGQVSACHWFSFERWELGPCLALELAFMRARLKGADLGTAASARAVPGARLALWVSDRISLHVSADVLLSLIRPRFVSADDGSIRSPLVSFSSGGGISCRL